MKTKAKPLSRATIRELANMLREQYDIPYDQPFPIMHYLEYCVNFEVVPDNNLGGCYAEAFPELGSIVISQSVYDGARKGNARDRFTICHEIGHLILHTPDRISFARKNEEIKPFCSAEWQANTFAGELLVSAKGIKKWQSADEIANRYKVSYTVANIQLKNL